MIRAELADGTVLEFPDGTDPMVIQQTVKKMLAQNPEMGVGQQALRAGEFAFRGFTENAARAIGGLPELVSSGVRAIGGGDYVPPAGYYPQKLKEGFSAVGQVVSDPINRALGFTGAGGEPTGKFGPSQPVGTLEKGAMGVGRGLADVGAFMVPGLAASKYGTGVTQKVGQVMQSQPGVQALAGSVGGATTEVTDNPWLGLAAALGTGVGASVALAKIAKHGATTLAEKKIIALITKIGDGDTEAGFRIVQQEMTKGGKDTALVDVLGIKGEKMARASANVPEGEGATIADDFVNARMAGRGERYQEAADVFGPRRNMPVLEEKMDIAQDMASGPHYEAAIAANPTIVSKEIDLILETPAGQTAFKKAVEMMLNDRSLVGKINPETTQALKDAVALGKMPDVKGGVADGLNMRVLDYVKRAMGDAEGKLIRSGETSEAGIIGGQRRSLTRELDAADVTAVDGQPGRYAQGRAAWQGVEQEKEAVELGLKFMRGDADVTARELARMSPAEQEAARMGARKAIGDMIRQDRQAVATRLADKKDAMWDRIRAVFPESEVDEFKRVIGIENKKMSVERFVGPRTGSHTAGIQQDVAALGRQLPESAMTGLEVGGQLLAGRPFRALAALGRPAVDYLSRPDAKTAEGLARMLLELNPKAQTTMLAELAKASQFKPEINVGMIRALMGKTTVAQEAGDYPQRNLAGQLGGNNFPMRAGRLENELRRNR